MEHRWHGFDGFTQVFLIDNLRYRMLTVVLSVVIRLICVICVLNGTADTSASFLRHGSTGSPRVLRASQHKWRRLGWWSQIFFRLEHRWRRLDGWSRIFRFHRVTRWFAQSYTAYFLNWWFWPPITDFRLPISDFWPPSYHCSKITNEIIFKYSRKTCLAVSRCFHHVLAWKLS